VYLTQPTCSSAPKLSTAVASGIAPMSARHSPRFERGGSAGMLSDHLDIELGELLVGGVGGHQAASDRDGEGGKARVLELNCETRPTALA